MEQYRTKATRTVANTLPVNATPHERMLEQRVQELTALVERQGRAIRRLQNSAGVVKPSGD